MTREQLAHVLRAASRIAEVRDVVVIGSQSVLGTFADEVLPEEVIGSIEVDVAFLDDPANEKSDKVDGAIGELSQFHETYQYYAQGVSTSTAVLGPGWEDRLVVFENASTKPGRGLCLDPHDCVAAKLVAGRDKDFEFAAALLREELVDAAHNHRKDRGPPGPVQPEAAPLQLGEGESGKGTGHLAFSAVSSTRLGAPKLSGNRHRGLSRGQSWSPCGKRQAQGRS